MPASSTSSSRASASRSPLMVAAAFVWPTAASQPLAFLRGTVVPAAYSLVIVDVGRLGGGFGSGGTAAPAARDLIIVDACIVRLLFEGLLLTSALDGRGRLRAADGCLSTPCLLAGDGGARSSRPLRRRCLRPSCGGRLRPPLVASSSSMLAFSAMVLGVVGQRRPPLATLSSLMPASSASSSRAFASCLP